MVHPLKEAETRETLRRCHANQQREALLPAAWTKPPANSYNVFLLFNLEAAWDEGHCILALGPVGGPLQTYSYYRHSSQLEAPGIMADLKEPMTFAELRERSGSIASRQLALPPASVCLPSMRRCGMRARACRRGPARLRA